MIWDSQPWRSHLLADACALATRAKTKRITERRSALVERAVFFGAYSMRKLDDAKKLSTSWKGTALKCMRYPFTGEVPDLLNWHHIDRHYDLSKPTKSTMGARDFCDLVVHSFIFSETIHDNRTIDGFFITSDRLKKQGLWYFEVRMIVGLMEQTAKDNPPSAYMSRDPDTGEFEVWAGDGEPPLSWKKKVEKLAARRSVLLAK